MNDINNLQDTPELNCLSSNLLITFDHIESSKQLCHLTHCNQVKLMVLNAAFLTLQTKITIK